MGDVSSEPSMEEILSSIKRVIEESETTSPQRASRRAARTNVTPVEPEDVTDPSRDEVLELSDRVTFPTVERDAPETPAAQPGKTESILSTVAAEASRGPLEALSRMIVKPNVAGSDTLEGLVREMLRPMLRDWLDSNLPGIVEAMVAKEIARISGRGL